MKKVLVCEDEQHIREFIVINLKRAGYETVEASNGDEAMEIFYKDEQSIDIAVLDIMMPGKRDGLQVCREIRNVNDTIGIILLSAKSQEVDKISGLMMGADDYVTKPFSPSELLARIDAINRRVEITKGQTSGKITEEILSGEFTLNIRNRTLTKKGKPVDLTQVEFQIMEYFIAHPSMPLSRNEILNKVWGASYTGEEKIVDVNIRRLRMKIEDDPSTPVHLLTVWGLGYRWES